MIEVVLLDAIDHHKGYEHEAVQSILGAFDDRSLAVTKRQQGMEPGITGKILWHSPGAQSTKHKQN